MPIHRERKRERERDLERDLSMAFASFPDIWGWIQSLPPTNQWKSDSISICISSTSSQPSLDLSLSKTTNSISFSLLADYNIPVVLWSSKQIKHNPLSPTILDDESVTKILTNLIKDVLNYCPIKTTSFFKLPKINTIQNLNDIFNLTFLCLCFIICIYEAPGDIRCDCLNNLKQQLACPRAREVFKSLMRLLGSNTEEQWMRSMNLAITNWIMELRALNRTVLKTPSPLYSHAVSALGLWKVQLYCPVIAMDVEKSNNPADEKLLFSLNLHQLEGVIQLNHQVVIREKWIDVIVNIDNIRCDITRLVDDRLMKARGAGVSEKHFPSRISLQLTPFMQANILSVSVSKSSENPTREIGIEKTIEGSFEPPNPYLALRVSSGETMTMSLKPWKFEQSVFGDSANLNWFLHDSINGREVFSSRPSKFQLLHPKAWFKNRYSSAYRPFTRQGGVIFAGDEYGEKVLWKVEKSAMGKCMEWEIKGWIWLTYWPNKHRTLFTETRRLEFREILHVTLA